MASCLAVVNSALRKCGVLGAGREARTADRDDAFEALKSLYRAWINQGTFGRLRDVIPVENYTAFGMERIFRNQSATLEITLPETVRNWEFWGPYWIYGRNWVPPATPVANWDISTPRDCSVVVINDAFLSATYEFIYDGQQKLWMGLYDLAIEDEAPLSYRDAQGLSACLAISIADEYGAQIGPSTVRQAQAFEYALANRTSSPRNVVQQEYF